MHHLGMYDFISAGFVHGMEEELVELIIQFKEPFRLAFLQGLPFLLRQIEQDRDKFNAYLKQQLKGLLLMSEKTGLSPENAQSLLQGVYEYFGLTD